MDDPSLPIQGALVAALKSHAALTVLIGGRVYDRVPANVVLPYVTVGEGLSLPDKADCVDGAESFPQISAYSDKPGFPEVKQIAAAIESALDENEDLLIAGHRLIAIEIQDKRFRRDADGLTSIADLTFRLLTEPSPD